MTAEGPLISVVIPTYNRRHVIERAVRSVLSQGMTDLELIVVDDGSTDGTAELLRRTFDDSRLTVIVQENGGVCSARNSGLAVTTTEFVVFLDSDDEAGEGWLEYFTEALGEGFDVASCGVHFVGPGTAYKLVLPERSDIAMGGLHARFLAGAFAIRTDLLREIGAFRAGMRFSEHTDLALRLGARSLERPVKTTHTDAPLVTMHRDDRPYDPALQYESAVMLLDVDDEHLRRSRTLHATYLGIAGVAASRLGRHAEARRLLARAVRADPLRPKHLMRLGRELVLRR